MYIYIYIYLFICVCVCVQMHILAGTRGRQASIAPIKRSKLYEACILQN